MTISPYVDSTKLDAMTGWFVLSTRLLTYCQYRETESSNFCIDVLIWQSARASQMGSSSLVSSSSSASEVVAITEPIWSSCRIRVTFILSVFCIQAFAVFQIVSCTSQFVTLVLSLYRPTWGKKSFSGLWLFCSLTCRTRVVCLFRRLYFHCSSV